MTSPFSEKTLEEVASLETDKLNDVHFEGFAEFRSGKDKIKLYSLCL
jgi:hypothetical protein